MVNSLRSNRPASRRHTDAGHVFASMRIDGKRGGNVGLAAIGVTHPVFHNAAPVQRGGPGSRGDGCVVIRLGSAIFPNRK